MNKKEIRLIGQGTYGCVFKPEILCKTGEPGSVKYLTKLQVADNYETAEANIGKRVQQIPNYQYFFAPILETCDVKRDVIKKTKVERCMAIKKNSTRLKSAKLRYVGDLTFGDYFYSLLYKSTKKYIEVLPLMHYYLLNSIQLLVDKGIVHLDLKEDNIIYDSTNDVMIIIDFGFATFVEDLIASKYVNTTSPFYISPKIYDVWCIEITIMFYISKFIRDVEAPTGSYRVDKKRFKQTIEHMDIERLKQICRVFVQENNVFKLPCFTKNIKDKFETILQKWVESFNGKTWVHLWETLYATHKSWDNYSLTILILYELSQSILIVDDPDNDIFLSKYIQLLIETITHEPGTRSTPKELANSIKNIFSKIDRDEYNRTLTGINAKKTKQLLDQIKHKKRQHTLDQLEEDAQLRTNFQRFKKKDA